MRRSTIGPFTSPRQIEIVERHVDDAHAKGARVLIGGRGAATGPGCFYEPTVLAGVDHSMLIMREETFGPVVPVMAVRDADEALRLANDSPLRAERQRLDARRASAASRWRSASRAATPASTSACVSAGVPGLPFGGVKQSGVGTRHGGRRGPASVLRAPGHPGRAAAAQDRARVVPVLGAKRARLLERTMASALRLAIARIASSRRLGPRRSQRRGDAPACCASRRRLPHGEPSPCCTSRRPVRSRRSPLRDPGRLALRRRRTPASRTWRSTCSSRARAAHDQAALNRRAGELGGEHDADTGYEDMTLHFEVFDDGRRGGARAARRAALPLDRSRRSLRQGAARGDRRDPRPAGGPRQRGPRARLGSILRRPARPPDLRHDLERAAR